MDASFTPGSGYTGGNDKKGLYLLLSRGQTRVKIVIPLYKKPDNRHRHWQAFSTRKKHDLFIISQKAFFVKPFAEIASAASLFHFFPKSLLAYNFLEKISLNKRIDGKSRYSIR